MKILLLTVASALSLSLIPTQSTSAYICVSKSASKFHFKKECSGLQRCTHEIKSITITEAKKLNYTMRLLED